MIVGESSPLLSYTSLAEEDIIYSSNIAELVSYWILGNTCYPQWGVGKKDQVCESEVGKGVCSV